jgi:hypothetical protein
MRSVSANTLDAVNNPIPAVNKNSLENFHMFPFLSLNERAVTRQSVMLKIDQNSGAPGLETAHSQLRRGSNSTLISASETNGRYAWGG